MKLWEFYQKKRPRSYVDNWHLRWMCEAFERAVLHRRNVIIQAPPRHSKSELCNVYGPGWALSEGRHEENFMLVTNSDQLSRKFSTACRQLVDLPLSEDKGHAWKLRAASDSLDASYHASGVKGQLSGRGASVLLVDDTSKNAAEFLSQTVRDSIWDNMVSAALNRLSPDGVVVATAARGHEQDVIGRLLGLTHLKYVVLKLPATNDSGTEAFFEDQYVGEKVVFPAYEALWPERYGRAKLDDIKATVSQRWWMGQYQCVPSMGEDLYFDLTKCPRHQTVGNTRMWWVACDFANTATATGSRSALVALGFDEPAGMLRVISAKAGRWRQDEMGGQLVEFVASTQRLMGTPTEAVIVERAAGGFGILDQYAGVLPMLPITPKGSKEIRAGEVCFLVNRGSVSLPESAPWLKEFIDEVGGFNLAPLSDYPDALTHALKFVVSRQEFKRPDEIVIARPQERAALERAVDADIAKDLGFDDEAAFDMTNGPELF